MKEGQTVSVRRLFWKPNKSIKVDFSLRQLAANQIIGFCSQKKFASWCSVFFNETGDGSVVTTRDNPNCGAMKSLIPSSLEQRTSVTAWKVDQLSDTNLDGSLSSAGLDGHVMARRRCAQPQLSWS